MKTSALIILCILSITLAVPTRPAISRLTDRDLNDVKDLQERYLTALDNIERKVVERTETPLNALVAGILGHMPILDGKIDAVASILTGFLQLVASLEQVQTSLNGLEGLGYYCTEYTVVFSRGTLEPGNVGVLTGPAFFLALQEAVGNSAVTVQGVNDYAADLEGYLAGGSAQGSEDMAQEIEQAVRTCPHTKLVVSGYSQGAQLVHNSISKLDAATASQISSVVVFGDPDENKPIPNVPASKVITFCNIGDDICQDGDIIGVPHLIYSLNATQAADFVISAAKA